MTDLLYSFDTSVMINGRRDLLPPDLFPTLWTKIEGMITAGAIRAVDVVRDELGRKDDATKEWATNQAALFLPLDEDIQVATREVLAGHRKLVGKGGRAAQPRRLVRDRARPRPWWDRGHAGDADQQPGEAPNPRRVRGDGGALRRPRGVHPRPGLDVLTCTVYSPATGFPEPNGCPHARPVSRPHPRPAARRPRRESARRCRARFRGTRGW